MKHLIIFLIGGYQKFISPLLVALLGQGCRYTPTCSEYAKEAMDRFGVVKGTQLSFIRISHCHPFVKSAKIYDPVPKS